MAATYHNRIEQSPLPADPIYREANAGAEIKPGSLLLVGNNGDYQLAGDGVNQPLFAVENVADAGGIDDVYPVGATIRSRAFQRGERVYAFLDNGAGNVTDLSTFLKASASGNGTLTPIAGETGKEIVARATEIVDNTSGSEPVRIVVEIL